MSVQKAKLYGSRWTLVLYLMPALVLYSVLSFLPSLLSVIYSFNRWRGLVPLYGTFNHFIYYRRMFHDSVVLTGLENIGRAIVLMVGFSIPVGLGLAFILSRYVRGTTLFRTLFFIPQIVSIALIALVFRLFLTTDAGLNGFLKLVGLGGWIRPWLSQVGLAPWIVNSPAAWMQVGFAVVLFVAAIRGIDGSLFEAAEVDGATKWQQLWHVTLPAIRGMVVLVFAITVISATQIYVFQLLMPTTPGGPFNTTQTVGSYGVGYTTASINYVSLPNFGYATALSSLMCALSAVGAVLIFLVGKRRER